MDKISKERGILELAKPTLNELYGNFSIIHEQQDRPDAAITIEFSRDEIGIEITSVDPKNTQQYLNDEKYGQDIKLTQINELISTGKHSDRPDKKISIQFPNTYIFDGVINKTQKHPDYLTSKKYKEVILIAFSEYFRATEGNFDSYHKPWTWNLLSSNSFPFDKVIFVCKGNGMSTLVYDKSLPPPPTPERDTEKELGITVISGPILPMGETVNLLKIYNNEPLINPRKKSKPKNKKQRKAQKDARKINRS